MAAVEASRARTYGNWRKPRSAGLGQLGWLGTMLLMAGLISVVVVLMLGGILRAVVVALVLGTAVLVIIVRDSHGLNLLDKGGTRILWWRARATGAALYRSGPLGRTPWGTHQLPGLAAALTLTEHVDSYGRPFAMIHCPSAHTYTVTIASAPDGASLVDPDVIDQWVALWGHWLGGLSDEPGLEAVSVTIETAPDTGARLRREVMMNTDPNAPDAARALLAEVVDSYPVGASTVRAFVSLTFASKGRQSEVMGRDLAARLPGLTFSLQATGAGAGHPLSAAELCEVVRVAYDPASQTAVDDSHAQGVATDLNWCDVGPAGAEVAWESYRHDGAVSVTWAMSTAPRGHVQSNVLTRLLAPHRDIARKRVTIMYRPIDMAHAAALVEKDVRAASFNASQSSRPTQRDVRTLSAAVASAQEEAAGSGLVNFAVLVTATTTREAKLSATVAAVDSLAATARLRLRPVYGGQDSAFVAALPLGIIPSKHLVLPASVRKSL